MIRLDGAVVSQPWAVWRGRLIWLSVPLAAALYQIAAKYAASAFPAGAGGLAGSSLGHIAMLLLVVVACDLACLVAWLAVLERASLAKAFPLSAASYILVIASSRLIFNEALSWPQGVGSAFILAGVWLVSGRGG